MKKNEDISEYREKTYLITKLIIEKISPDELIFFELGWHNLWNEICQLEDKDPRECNIEYKLDFPSSIFSYPSPTVNQRLTNIGFVNFKILSDFLALNHEASLDEAECIIRKNLKPYNTPESIIQDLLSIVQKVIKIPNSEKPKEEKDEQPPPPQQQEEKKEYKVYSHLYKDKPYFATQSEVKALEKRALKEEKAFDIYYNYDMREIVVHNKSKSFIPKRGKSAVYQIKLLKLFLQNVGGFVSAKTISQEVWCDFETKIRTIQQKKGLINIFTEKAIDSFVTWDNTSDIESGLSFKGYIIKENDFFGNQFKYCLVEKSES